MKDTKNIDTMKLEVGSKVFYPTHGAGRIKAQKKIEFQGEKKDYFEFEFIDAQLTVSTPIDNVQELGVREVMDVKDIRKIISELKKKPSKKPAHSDYNEIIKDIQDLDAVGEVGKFVEVIQLCNAVKSRREKEGRLIPVSIKKHIKTAIDHIIAEMAISEDTDLETAAKSFKRATGMDIETEKY